ncbi:MAG: hypothetical protein Q8P44_10820 [Dehalococcoidia bacterium]|nr:hypothetical protein [Dehalococcoidia bacterium]
MEGRLYHGAQAGTPMLPMWEKTAGNGLAVAAAAGGRCHVKTRLAAQLQVVDIIDV